MQKCFFLICPTDYLENAINKTFRSQNYFYTSLGNSFIYDDKTMKYIKQIVKKHNIQKFCFVLSIDNKIVLDALWKGNFSKIGALSSFQNEIRKEKELSKKIFKSSNSQFAILSYFLNKKIKDFKLHLNTVAQHSINIEAKVYYRNQNRFSSIYSDLVCLQQHHFN